MKQDKEKDINKRGFFMQLGQKVQIDCILYSCCFTSLADFAWLEGRDCRTKLPGTEEKSGHAGFDEQGQDSTNKFAQKVSKPTDHY